jgi:tetratricopeptide (TPR) repeat protein
MRCDKKILILMLIILSGLYAGCLADDYYGIESLYLVGAGARAMGMGGAFAAVCDDGSAVYYNPAGLANLEYRELVLLNSSLYENTGLMFGGFSYPVLGFGTVGIAGIRIGTDEVIFRDRLGELGSHNYSEGQYWLSYGVKVRNYLSAGVNFKYLNQSLGDFSSSTGSFDLAFLADYKKKFFIGINAQDIISGELEMGGSGEKIPFNLKGGVAFRHDFEKIGLILALDGDKTRDAKTRFHFGGEFCYNELIRLRGGFDRAEITIGAGLKYKLLTFDYAFRTNSDLGGNHRLGISFRFGPSLSVQKARRLEVQRQEDIRRAEEARRDQIAMLLSKADVFYGSEVWDSASFYYSQVLAFDPENAAVIPKLREMAARAESEVRSQIDIKAVEMAYRQLLEKYNRNADSLFAAEEYENARMEYAKILELDSADQHALDRLRRIDELYETRFIELIAEGETYMEQELYAEAVVAYNEARKLKPDDRNVRERINLAKTRLLVVQKLKTAVELLNNRDTAAAKTAFGEILQIDPEEKVAADYLEKLRERIPIRPVPIDELKADQETWRLYLEGLQYFSEGEYEKAIENWEIVLDKYPGSEDTRENLRQARLRLGRQGK